MPIPDSPQHDPMSQRAYAKRKGVSHVAVNRAIKAGRLSASVRDGQIIDADLADREWAASTDYSKAPSSVKERAAEINRGAMMAPAPVDQAARVVAHIGPSDVRGSGPGPTMGPAPVLREGMTLSEAGAVEKYWKAMSAELDYRTEAAELVERAEVKGKLEQVFRACRTKLLGLPTRARQALPHLTVVDVGVLDDLVREALEDLAKGGIA